MAEKLVGIIDIGSHAVRLEIFEARSGRRNGVFDAAVRSLNLGQDVFRRGTIAPENIAVLSGIVGDFARKLKENDVTRFRAVGTSALREAANRELVIDRVRNDTGVRIEILEPQEEIRLYFLAMRDRLRSQIPPEEFTGVGFIVGTGSLLVTAFERGVLKFSEAAPIGSIRTIDEFGTTVGSPTELMIENLFSLDLKRRMLECTNFDPARPSLLVGMGGGVRQLCGGRPELTPAEAAELAERAVESEHELLRAELSTADYLAVSVPASAALLNYFLREFKCSRFLAPELSTRTALADDLLRRGSVYDSDIRSCVEGVAGKYGVDLHHTHATVQAALKLFDKLEHRFEMPARGRLLLELAGLLHDIGRFVDTRQHHLHSYYLILNTQLPGVDEAEKKVIAAVARYHRRKMPDRTDPEFGPLPAADKVAVLKLAAILRLADALPHLESRGAFKPVLAGDTLILRSPAFAESAFSSVYLNTKSDLFFEVFGLKIRLEEVSVSP